jgi:glycosyltransferase involved in cell wall biosynthesis
MLSSVWAALQVKDVDLIMGTTPPIFQAVSAWLVAFIRRKPFLLEVRDLWPEFAISMGVIKNPTVIALAHWLENFLYARATHILVNSPAYKKYIVSKGVPERKITFIPYGADIDVFHPHIDGSSVRERLGLKDKFLVLYAGAMGQAHDLYTVLRAAKRLNGESHIQFVFFGAGKERANLESEAQRLGLENVLFAGICPKKEMPAVIAAADVCLAILQNLEMFRTTYPNKVFDYMASARPTVLVIDGVVRDVIEASNGGMFVEPGNDELLAKTILELSRDPQRVRQMGENARSYLVKNLDRRDKLAETLQLLESLINK